MMNTNAETLVLGAGPAGLQLGYFFERQGRDYLILERGDKPGGFFEHMPRHRMLISINKVHTGTENSEANLRWDWNSLLSDSDELLFKHYSQEYFPNPDVLLRYLDDYAAHYDLKIRYQAPITRVAKEGGRFILTDEAGDTYTGERLIVATGLWTPYTPEIPGIELCDQYADHSLDLADYTDKRVLVIGKGNSAFETADHLIEAASAIHICSPHSVKFAWETHFVGNLRAVNNNFLDTYQLKSQNTVVDAGIEWIEKEGEGYAVKLAYTHAKGQTRLVHYDKVIVCTGFRFDDTIFDESCRPELAHEGRLPAQTEEWESANVPGMYFAGTIMQACDYKKTMSGFIHGFRYNVRALSNVLEMKYHGEPWPVERFEATPEAVLGRVLDRVNYGSGIFLQPGFLCDVVVVREAEGVAEYYQDMRTDYVPASWLAENEHYYTVRLAYGRFEGDPFSVARDPDPMAAAEAAYLHPIIRRYSRGEFIGEHHIQDDLESQWYREEYVVPARAYFEAQLSEERVGTPRHN
jgi:thioredoxin reductase